MYNRPKSLINEDNSLVSDQKPYFLCMDSTDVPNPHNISRNEAQKHLSTKDNPTGICIGYDALACNNIYYPDRTEPNLVYPCWWDNTTKKCGVDPQNNPKLGKHTGYPVNSITIGKNDEGKKKWDTSCFRLMGDPNCLYNNTDCADTATTDVYDALKCWVGKDGIPYTSNSNLMPDSEREERTVPLAYGECSWWGSNCVPEGCGCGGWYNEARWGGLGACEIEGEWNHLIENEDRCVKEGGTWHLHSEKDEEGKNIFTPGCGNNLSCQRSICKK